MRIIHSLDEMTETARGWLAGGPVGFIPTSGRLHSGHLSLVRAAQRECEITVVSIFANEATFNPLHQSSGLMYDLSRDVQLLETAQIDVVFIPRPEDIYPPTFSTYVMTSGPIVERLECALFEDQPYFFSTLFTRLLLLIRPDIAYFGQKSAQYAALMRRLIHDLSIDTSLRVLPTVREGDGLALSCDNVLLSPVQRQAAPLLYRALLNAKTLIEQGERQVPFLKQTMTQIIASSPLLHLDYVAICDPSAFHELDVLPDLTPTLSSSGFILAVAAYADTVRLIDNIQFASNGYWLI